MASARVASYAGADLSRRLKHNLRIVYVMAVLDFKLKYAGSALGYVWSVVKPLALFTCCTSSSAGSSTSARSRSTTRSRS